MNFIEQLFNDFNERYIKEAKAKGVDLGLQTVYTPIDKIEKATGFRFADHITADTKSVAVLFNTEFINYFLKELPDNYINNIKFTFFYDCKFDYNEVQDCIFFSQKNINIEMISIENIKDLDKVMTGKKFDIVFSNPPYGTSNSNSLDLNILKQVLTISKNVIFIHPSDWFLKKKCNRQIKIDLKKSSFLKKIAIFWGNELFDIGLFVPLCISLWNTENTNNYVEVNDLAYSKKIFNCKGYDFSIHYGNVLEIINDYNKFETFVSTLNEHSTVWNHRVKPDYSDMTEYSIRMPILQGGMYFLANNPKKDFRCDSTCRANRNRDDERRFWSFENKNDRENFIKYFKAKIVRFILSLLKTDQNMGPDNYKMIPWMDFTQEWNDAKLCKEFGISEELWNYIDKFIPDYYEDYKSGFEK